MPDDNKNQPQGKPANPPLQQSPPQTTVGTALGLQNSPPQTAAVPPVTPLPPVGTPSPDQMPPQPPAVGNPPRRTDVGPGAPITPALSPYQIPRKHPDENTVTMMVPRAFRMRLDTGELVEFKPGSYEIPEHLAGHKWLANNGVVRHGKEVQEKLSRGEELQRRREELARMEEDYRAEELRARTEEKTRERQQMAEQVTAAEQQTSSRPRSK